MDGIQTIVCSGGSKGGARDARPPLGVQILSFSCSFWPKKLVSTPNLGVGAPPPPGKILDPPLVCDPISNFSKYLTLKAGGTRLKFNEAAFYFQYLLAKVHADHSVTVLTNEDIICFMTLAILMSFSLLPFESG